MIVDVLLRWLMAYVGLLAAVGFGLYVVRGAWRRDWSNRMLLRASSSVAFVSATVFWLVLALAE